jgi:hypothetical protein
VLHQFLLPGSVNVLLEFASGSCAQLPFFVAGQENK